MPFSRSFFCVARPSPIELPHYALTGGLFLFVQQTLAHRTGHPAVVPTRSSQSPAEVWQSKEMLKNGGTGSSRYSMPLARGGAAHRVTQRSARATS